MIHSDRKPDLAGGGCFVGTVSGSLSFFPHKTDQVDVQSEGKLGAGKGGFLKRLARGPPVDAAPTPRSSLLLFSTTPPTLHVSAGMGPLSRHGFHFDVSGRTRSSLHERPPLSASLGQVLQKPRGRR